MSRLRLASLSVLILSSVALAEPPPPATYTNPLPLNLADPFVFHEGDTYYAYGTSARYGFLVWTSNDLVNWQSRGYAYERDVQSFGRFHFWAPEMFKHRGKYYLHFTAAAGERENPHRRIVLAESDSPLGPFKQVKGPWFETEFDTIDSHVFRDNDGRMYLYSVQLPKPPETRAFQIRVRKLDDSLVPSAESTLCITPSEKWEGGVVNEGPVRHPPRRLVHPHVLRPGLREPGLLGRPRDGAVADGAVDQVERRTDPPARRRHVRHRPPLLHRIARRQGAVHRLPRAQVPRSPRRVARDGDRSRADRRPCGRRTDHDGGWSDHATATDAERLAGAGGGRRAVKLATTGESDEHPRAIFVIYLT
jgi:hypothetical protein